MFFAIPDLEKAYPGSRGQKGAGSRTRNTECFSLSFPDCRSSRSHTIFRIQLESANRLGDETTTSEDPDSSKEGRQVGGEALKRDTKCAVLRIRDPGFEPLDPGKFLFQIPDLGSRNQTHRVLRSCVNFSGKKIMKFFVNFNLFLYPTCSKI